jgi:DNA-directed RNA polymerase subunit RPC12/RpoP
MAEWQRVPPDFKYWHPINVGFNGANARFVCSQCHGEFALAACIDCGDPTSWLGTTMGLPGVFCKSCGNGAYVWDCPSCGHRDKTSSTFQFDASQIQVRKKRFFE